MTLPDRQLSDLTSAELLARAARYRAMAATAATEAVRKELLDLAERLEEMAARKQN